MNISSCFKLLSLLLLSYAHAVVDMPGIFANDMVLQRNAQIPVWGAGASAGQSVTVQFAGQTQRTTVNNAGEWRVHLNAMSASSTGRSMSIQVGSASRTITGILVGEVWLCSGQSNMEWTMRQLSNSNPGDEGEPASNQIDIELASASDSLMRQFKVTVGNDFLTPQEDLTGSWVSADSLANARTFSGTAYYFAKSLRDRLNVPVGVINSCLGSTQVQSWFPYSVQQQDPIMLANTLNSVNSAKSTGDYSSNRLPGSLYNFMIHPLRTYAIKGAIWYQGEANTNVFPDDYNLYLSSLIQSWRSAWGQGDFPFYFAQLANYKALTTSPIETDTWATVQDQQRLTLQTTNTGMAVLNDVGEAGNVHPRNKIDVGNRLGLWALNKTYGINNIIPSGPLYRSNSLNGSTVTVTFDYPGSGLMTGSKTVHYPTVRTNESVKGFQICGSNRTWYWANAEISSSNTVTLSHPSVPTPTEIRYDWAANTSGINLYNSAGLPTSTFKADVSSVSNPVTEYTVTFNLGNGSRSGGGALSQTVTSGGNATAPTVTPPSGYTFAGWSRTFTNVTSNLTVNAQYDVIDSGSGSSYTLSNGTGRFVKIQIPKTQKLTLSEVEVFVGGSNIALNKAATQSSDLGSLYTASVAVDGVKTGNTAFTSTQFEANPWWQVDLGSAQNIEQIIVHNTKRAADITRLDGFTISILNANGSTASTLTGVAQADTITFDTNITTTTPTEYTVTFNLGNGSRSGGGALSQTVTSGGNATAPTVTPPSGYTFAGWDRSFTNVTSNLTVNAQYDVIDSGSGSAYTFSNGTGRFVKIQIPKTQKLTLSEVEVLVGGSNIALNKVATQSSDLGSPYVASVAVDGVKTGNTAFTSTQFEANPWWQVDLGSTQDIEQIIVHNTKRDADISRLDGFTISILNANGSTASTLTGVAQADTITFDTNIVTTTPTEYTVTFDLGDGSRSGGGALSQTISSGGSATAPTVTPPSGYTFSGWDRSFTNVTSNLTVTAQYDEDSSDNVYDMSPVRGRIIRVELPAGSTRPLRLAEVEVYSNGENVATLKSTSQSSIFSQLDKYLAAAAVDSGRESTTGSYTQNESNPWWEVDLGTMTDIEKVMIYRSNKSLSDMVVTIMDANRNVLYTKSAIPDATTTVFMSKDLGNLWVIGDQISRGHLDGDANTSPRSAFYDVLTSNDYSFSFTGHVTTNTEGLPNATYRSHSAINLSLIHI